MEDTITIKRSDLHHVFERMEILYRLRKYDEKSGDSLYAEKWLSEWIGMLEVLFELNLMDERTQWILEQCRNGASHG